jgi:glycerate dehydrogenase
MKTNVLVTYEPGKEVRKIYREKLDGLAQVRYLKDEPDGERTELLKSAEIIIALGLSPKEIEPVEATLLENARLIQLIYAGADKVPFKFLPDHITLASNVGAFAEPIAEHVLALALALAKKLISNNRLLKAGTFDRSGFNLELRGKICGIIGLGGNGREIAKTMQALSMKVYGINRSGKTDAPVDFIGSGKDMKMVLAQSHVVVVTAPLTGETKNLIGKKELEGMKEDAILINVGRGHIIDQKALYDHLKAHPAFCAGIDTWWSEPAASEAFKPDYPFFELPNLIGSPHNADHVPRSIPKATRSALENVKNFLIGKDIRGVLKRKDYLD